MAPAEQDTPPNPHITAGGRRRRQIHPQPLSSSSSWCLMDLVPPSSSSTRRRKQSPTPPCSSPGLLIDPRLPNYRRIAPIPRIRRSPPFSKHLRDCDGITPSALTSSSLTGDDGHGGCNGLSSWTHTSSPLVGIDEIQQLTSSGDESPPPLTTSSSAEIQPPLTTSSSSVDPHPASLTTQELGLANLIMCYRSIVLFVVAAVFIYNEHDYPAVMISEIAGVLCIYMHFWSLHITQFWLNCPPDEDSSPIRMLCCFAIFMFAFLIGIQHSVHAGMCITLLTTMCMAGYLISCIHDYNCTRRHQNVEHPPDLDLHQDEHTQDSKHDFIYM